MSKNVISMINYFVLFLSVIFLSGTLACNFGGNTATATMVNIQPTPKPIVNSGPVSPKGLQTAVFAGGCFWGVEAVFEHVKGVTEAKSGYTGGNAKTASYETVSGGNTGHAESVQVTFDPSQVSYETLLKVFFS